MVVEVGVLGLGIQVVVAVSSLLCEEYRPLVDTISDTAAGEVLYCLKSLLLIERKRERGREGGREGEREREIKTYTHVLCIQYAHSTYIYSTRTKRIIIINLTEATHTN